MCWNPKFTTDQSNLLFRVASQLTIFFPQVNQKREKEKKKAIPALETNGSLFF